jgi:deoxyribodipyrimidine photo-lyase
VTDVPATRVRVLDDTPVRPDGAFVLYWMTATRRLGWSYAMDRSVEHARALGKPLLILEGVESDYRWASDRHHAAILDGMREHDDALRDSPVGYYPYVEPEPGAGRGLLAELAERACVLVTDDSPVFFTPKLLAAATALGACRVEAIDSCGLLPLAAAQRSFGAAYHLRRFLQKQLPEHLLAPPRPDALESEELPRLGSLPDSVLQRWPRASRTLLEDRDLLADLPIDHSVAPTGESYGHTTGRKRLDRFLDRGLPRYAERRNDPDADAASGLSPWLHYGHLSSHEVLHAVAERERWSPRRISERADGRRAGWWGMTDGAEAFLDQLVTWRELGYIYCHYETEFADYETLPDWARQTLEAHATDRREHVYTLEELSRAETDDELWNAAQRQLLREGVIQNYLRMLWGKKILEWTPHPREALDRMIELNNRYAVDGRDPNSYSGIFWVLGRFDRGWPERPIFGKVRSMTSDSARRKLDLDRYLARWGDQPSLDLG